MMFLMTQKQLLRTPALTTAMNITKLLAALSEACHKQLSGMTVSTTSPCSLEPVTAEVPTMKTESSSAFCAEADVQLSFCLLRTVCGTTFS